jgi:O-antigen/teichoic acid export membrane protein
LVLSIATILIAERDIAVTTLFYIHFFFTFLPGFFLLLRTFFRGKLWAYDIEAVNLIPLRNVFIFSLSAYASNIIFFIASKMAVFILPFWADPLHLGNFMQAYKIVEYAGMVTAFIYFPMISISADQTTFNSEAIILFLVRLSNTFVIFASISIMFAGPYVFQIIFGDSFFQLHEILICFIPGMLAVCSSTFFTAYFFGKGKTKINFYSAVILLSSLSLLMFVFANNGNVKWAAIAFSIANMLSFMYDIYQFNFLHKFTWKEIMILNKMDLLKLKLIFIANVSKVKSNAI